MGFRACWYRFDLDVDHNAGRSCPAVHRLPSEWRPYRRAGEFEQVGGRNWPTVLRGCSTCSRLTSFTRQYDLTLEILERMKANASPMAELAGRIEANLTRDGADRLSLVRASTLVTVGELDMCLPPYSAASWPTGSRMRNWWCSPAVRTCSACRTR